MTRLDLRRQDRTRLKQRALRFVLETIVEQFLEGIDEEMPTLAVLNSARERLVLKQPAVNLVPKTIVKHPILAVRKPRSSEILKR